ncbi:MAG: cytochrome d ubiquinol oxidase subunit II, partial [Chlamydiae bacterium]|nr:cytochrome d ubiquinol oxidase subunit II [Chlamydiota bacterium]
VLVGALLSGFPPVYAALCSGFYNLVMLLLAALIFRAVAIEFRSKKPSKRWRFTWDFIFSLSSLNIAFGVGLVLGNLVEGLPIDEHMQFAGNTSLFFRPFPILVAITSVALLTMHGAIYLVMKTEGELHDKLRVWANRSMIFFAIMYFCLTVVTLTYLPHMAERFRQIPWLMPIAMLAMLSFANIPREFSKGNDGWAFLSSCSVIGLLILLFGIGTFPNLIASSVDSAHNLTIFNASSSARTLSILLIIVAIGIPLVLAYGTCIYRIFRGKVKIGSSSY